MWDILLLDRYILFLINKFTHYTVYFMDLFSYFYHLYLEIINIKSLFCKFLKTHHTGFYNNLWHLSKTYDF